MRKIFLLFICLILSFVHLRAQCGILPNVLLTQDVPFLNTWYPVGGYVSGTGDEDYDPSDATIAIAQQFTTASGYAVRQASIYFGYCTVNSYDSDWRIPIYIYDNTGISYFNTPGPGRAVDSAFITLAQVAQNATNNYNLSALMPVTVNFNPGIPLADTTFYIVIPIPQIGGDTIAVFTNNLYTHGNNGWLQLGTHGWLRYDSVLVGGNGLGNYITVTSCPGPLTVNLGNSRAVCIGSDIILPTVISGGVSPYTYAWHATGDTLNCLTCAYPKTSITRNAFYSVTVTDAVGNSASASVNYNATANVNPFQLSVVNTGLDCSTGVDTTSINVIGGISAYTFNWSSNQFTTGSTLGVHNYTQVGIIIIAVTDTNGCEVDVLDTIATNGPVIAAGPVTQPLCPFSADGSIAVSVSGGTLPYNYSWNNGAQTRLLTNIAAADYGLIVIDSVGCKGLFNYFLHPANDPDYYVYLNTTNSNCAAPGLILSTITGGASPYKYSWSNGDSSANIQPRGVGLFGLTVTDLTGCAITGSVYLHSNCYGIINGIAFIDSNTNCIFDTSEWPLANYIVSASTSNGNVYYGSSDINGRYSIEVNDTGIFTISGNSSSFPCGNPAVCYDQGDHLYIPVLGDTINHVNVALQGTSGLNLGIHPGWTSANPGFTKHYWIYYYNSTPISYPRTSTITFSYDSNIIYINSSDYPLPVNNALDHTLTWTIDSIPGFDTWLQVDAYFQLPSSLNLDYLLKSYFKIEPIIGDCNPKDNFYALSEIVTGSHDPNEKSVSPSGLLTSDDSVLTYTIHFQNTGTDSTHFVIVKDTLSHELNAATVVNIASSDKYSSFTVTGEGILTWIFNPLRIVDSLTDPGGSKRFITFSVERNTSLPDGVTIFNTASVYFDYNLPLITNQVVDTIAAPLLIGESNNLSVIAYPNPFSDITNIVVNGVKENYEFELYDVTGRLQRIIPSIGNNRIILNSSGLAKGVYLYRIIVNNQPMLHGKLIGE